MGIQLMTYKIFPDLSTLEDEDVSYDVESLFTNIPVKETIYYTIDQIYEQKKLTPICKK